ncbi:unnamed protein product [Brachionus calyciflorus]|uniref:GCF C-terminal domain-containing protein n=1 Tax=Brachionus calyciflorus TaxID=104777 RepID=A0A814BRE6_9BILA|nr:unnamed protein product [Brachionus calyciflorus]
MFKKSNRNFRTKRAETDSDEENESVNQSVSIKPQKEASKSDIKITKLSFDNDEETEEFKVKKSKESRRIVKEQKKSKKEKEKQQIKVEEPEYKTQIKTETKEVSPREILFNDEIKIKPLQKLEKNVSKFSTNKYRREESKSEDEFESYKIESDEEEVKEEKGEDETDKLRLLREEFEILNGEDLDPLERETDEAKRSMKLMLKSGIIPNANIIHEARKKREMARQGDYIPIGRQTNIKGRSTLVREDEEDLSEDEHGVTVSDSRLTMNFIETSHKERLMTRNNFLAYEQGSDDEKKSDLSEDELERWEKEQIKKGVQISQLSSNDFKDMKKAKFIEKLLGSNLEPEPMEIESTYEQVLSLDKLNNLPQISFLSIKDSLKTNLNSLEETYRAHLNEYNMTTDNLNANKTDLENLKNSKPSLDEQYVYYQEMKAYLTDYIECYDEKILEIEKAEKNWLDLHKEKAQKILKRRHDNLRDQNTETTRSLTLNKKPFEAGHLKRMVERENRRTKRKLIREEKKKLIKSHLEQIELNEGFSTDDEESLTDEDQFKEKRQFIITQLSQELFNDVLEDFYKFDSIKQRFEKWKKINEQNYKNAFVSLSLPKLFSPLVRAELLDWNPLEIDEPYYLEKTKWFLELICFNKQDLSMDKKDEDFMIIPHIVEKLVMNRLISITESIYDPFSRKQTQNFANFFVELVKTYPTLSAQSLNSKKFIETIIARFKKTFEEEVFVPLYSKQLINQKNSEPSKFFHRQFYSCIKVFSNVLLWKEVLSESILKELAIDCLLNRYLLIGLQNLEPTIETIRIIEYLTSKLPKKWLETNIESTNTMNLPQLTSVIRLIRRIADQINENDFKTNRISPNEFKMQIQEIRKLFQMLGASDQAMTLSNTYEL